MNEYKLFAQRIGLVGITNILVALSSLILLPIITKNFSTSDYGIWIQVNTTITLIPNIATLGLPYTMIRFLSTEKDKKKIQEGFYSITIIVLISTFIISFLLLYFSKNIASTLFNGDVNLVMLTSIIIFLACINSLLLNFFRTFQQIRKYSIFLLIQTYLGLIIVSYFAMKGFNINILPLGILISNLISFFIMILFIISNIGFKIPKFKNIKEYLSFGLPTLPSNLSYWIVDSSDRYIIGLILGTTFVGYYSPGYALGTIIIMIMAPFSFLLPSLLPEYYDNGNIEKVKVFLNYSLKYFLLMAIPSVFVLSVLSKHILMILTTPEIALNGYMVTPFVALSALLSGIYGIVGNIIILEKKTKIIGIVWIIAAIINILLNMIFVPYFGIIGAATVTLVSYMFSFVISTYYSLRYLEFNFNFGFILKSVTSSILISLFVVIINPEGILNILIVVGVCIALYSTILFLMKGIKKDEIYFFKNFLN